MNGKQITVQLATLGAESTITTLKESGVLWARYKSGAWNSYGEPVPTEEVFDLIRKSPYGATAELVYNGEPLDDDNNLLYAQVCMPCKSDMY